ncbi:MAG TPA: hypothetical protein VMW15_15390 [Terracidiphilus sp.]|nr:hypothetical protein [Terracidiphilus sp.]
MRTRRAAIALLIAILALPVAAQRRVPNDLSGTRGFNYQSAETIGHAEFWLQYNPAVTERDLDYAKRLQLNQVRVFVPYAAWVRNKEAFRKNLLHFVRAAHERGIGVMPTMQYKFGEWKDKKAWPNSREFVADLVATIGKEPGLEIWDVENEPECCSLPPSPDNLLHMEHARYMARMFHELDPVTPVTIGATFVENMIAMGDAVDVLSFHNYSPTRAQIRANIAKAKQYAAQTGKPLIDTEIGCIARANPYDVTLQEHMQAHVGWYIWELMITGNWGTVHGVFYPDGTVRDPSIVAALLGFFRNRGENVVESVPDRENHVTDAVTKNRKWLAEAHPDWDTGLDLAEISANLIEAAQLAPMHNLPSRQVILMRNGQPDIAALRSLLEKFTAVLAPYRLPAGDPRHSRPPGFIQ